MTWILVYSILFGIGKLLFGDLTTAAAFFVIAPAAPGILYFQLSRIGWEKLAE